MVEKRSNQPWHRLAADEALERLESQREGLSQQEADSRRDEYGPNTIRTEEKVSPWKVLLDQFTSPLIYILLVALAVTLAIQFWGQGQHWGDAVVIGIVLAVNAVVGFFQEYRAEKAVQSLMEMVSPKAGVRRDGKEQQIGGEDLVPGDVVILNEGDMVPADVRVIDSTSLQVNESALTGESVPVSKTTKAMSEADENLPPADQENTAFMGTAVTSGRGEGVIVATGRKTELGKIAEGVREAGEIETPLQRRMDRLSKWIAVAIVIIAAVAYGVGVWMGNSWEDMLLLAVSLSVAAIPAGLPVVMTVALAIGVRRMARQHAVIRNLPAVETLGSTTTIVSDKTGTLTQNQMVVEEIFAGDELYQVSGEAMSIEGEVQRDGEPVDIQEGTPLFETLLAGFLNNSASVKVSGEASQEEQSDRPQQKESASDQSDDEKQVQEEEEDRLQYDGDPMEVALLVAAQRAGLSREELLEKWPQTGEVPFQTERRFSATIHDASQHEEGPLVLIKGAPEVVLEMCDWMRTGEGEKIEIDRDRLQQRNDDLAARGLRVLAMAVGRGQQAAESIQSDQPQGMIFAGMQGLLDPPRPEAIEAIDRCHESGIRVLMVTGDHARTAAAIAHQMHLGQPAGDQEAEKFPEAHTGQQVADLPDDELDEILRRGSVYARFKPNQKLRLVNRLKEQREIVAVTGDGVNDAPALKAGHLGAAMGIAGTDVAKEASDMVITDDNFASIYAAVEQGRTAFRNIRMATFFLLSTGAADVIIILGALGAGWKLPLLPAQILWCNVVTNGIADVALGFEPGERSLFRRPPRPPGEGVLDRMLLERLAIVGVWLAVGVLGVFYWINTYRDESLTLARTAALTTLVLFQKVHVFNCRSEDVSIFKKSLLDNKVLFIGVIASLIVHIAALYIPWTQKLLSVEPLPWHVWAVASCVAATAIVVNELHKRFRPREKFGRGAAGGGIPSLLSRGGKPGDPDLARKVEKRLDSIEQTVEENRELLDEIADSKPRSDN